MLLQFKIQSILTHIIKDFAILINNNKVLESAGDKEIRNLKSYNSFTLNCILTFKIKRNRVSKQKIIKCIESIDHLHLTSLNFQSPYWCKRAV